MLLDGAITISFPLEKLTANVKTVVSALYGDAIYERATLLETFL